VADTTRLPNCSHERAAVSTSEVDNYGFDINRAPESCDYIAPAVVALLGRSRVQRVIDIGAGNGTLCAMVKAALPGCHVAGVEYDAQGVEVARREHPGINFYHQGVQDNPAQVLGEEGEAFDAVVCTEVVEHLFSPHLLPRYAAGLLRPQGLLVVTTPYHGYLKNLALSLTGSWDKHHSPLWHGGHIKFWSRRTLTQLLEDNGFEVTEFMGVGRLPYLWKSMVLTARKRVD
jgi:2-polyprenyl-3-methyl-5-hydroxy-6-metoxy-1,4-benzoquinol methylase